jgi:DNA invertase Pin-like site-specific DNA recombinase
MVEIIEHDGTPVVVGRKRYYPSLRIRAKPRKLRDKPFRNMNEQQRQALRNIAEMGIERKKEAVTAAGYSEHNSLSTANRLLQSKPIVDALKNEGIAQLKIVKAIDAEIKAKNSLSKHGK